jgi:hypothetical protein
MLSESQQPVRSDVCFTVFSRIEALFPGADSQSIELRRELRIQPMDAKAQGHRTAHKLGVLQTSFDRTHLWAAIRPGRNAAASPVTSLLTTAHYDGHHLCRSRLLLAANYRRHSPREAHTTLSARHKRIAVERTEPVSRWSAFFRSLVLLSAEHGLQMCSLFSSRFTTCSSVIASAHAYSRRRIRQ